MFRRRLETLEKGLYGRRFTIVDFRFQRDGGELWLTPEGPAMAAGGRRNAGPRGHRLLRVRGRRPRGRSGAHHPLRTPLAHCVANRAALEAAVADRSGVAAGHAASHLRNRSYGNADARQEKHHRAHICRVAHRRSAGLHAGGGHRRWRGRQTRRPADQRRNRHARRT